MRDHDCERIDKKVQELAEKQLKDKGRKGPTEFVKQRKAWQAALQDMDKPSPENLRAYEEVGGWVERVSGWVVTCSGRVGGWVGRRFAGRDMFVCCLSRPPGGGGAWISGQWQDPVTPYLLPDGKAGQPVLMTLAAACLYAAPQPCTCIYMCTRLCAWMCVHAFVRARARMCTRLCACMCARACVCVYVCGFPGACSRPTGTAHKVVAHLVCRDNCQLRHLGCSSPVVP